MRDNLKDFVNANRDAFDRKEPSADLWNKIRPQVVPQVEEKKIKPLWRWASIAAATLLVGAAAFVIFNQEKKDDRMDRVAVLKSSPVQQKEAEEILRPSQQEIVAEAEQKESIRSIQTMTRKQKTHLVANRTAQKIAVEKEQEHEKDYMQMLQDSVWASTRLAAVLALQKQGNLKKDETQALEKIAVSDESSNVRMAAIETLLDGMTPEVRQQKVQDFFVAQNDPTLQVELMQMIAQRDEAEMKNSTKDKLNAIVEDPFTLKFVKEQAYAVLLQQ